jgi:hypothetical protein
MGLADTTPIHENDRQSVVAGYPRGGSVNVGDRFLPEPN